MWKVKDLAGCEVFDAQGNKIGVLYDVLPSGSNDIWALKNANGKEILIPALKEVVTEVNTEAKKIVVNMPTGLREIYEDEN